MSGFRRPPSDVERMTSLRVGNLPFRAHSDDLLPLFEKYGDVGDVYIPLERGSGRSRGFAFVRYYDKRDAEVCTRRKCFESSIKIAMKTWPTLTLTDHPTPNPGFPSIQIKTQIYIFLLTVILTQILIKKSCSVASAVSVLLGWLLLWDKWESWVWDKWKMRYWDMRQWSSNNRSCRHKCCVWDYPELDCW